MAERWRQFKHWLQHWFGLNPCHAISELRGDDVWLNHQCNVCGKRGEWWKA